MRQVEGAPCRCALDQLSSPLHACNRAGPCACLARAQHVSDLEAELDVSSQQIRVLQKQLASKARLVRVFVCVCVCVCASLPACEAMRCPHLHAFNGWQHSMLQGKACILQCSPASTVLVQLSNTDLANLLGLDILSLRKHTPLPTYLQADKLERKVQRMEQEQRSHASKTNIDHEALMAQVVCKDEQVGRACEDKGRCMCLPHFVRPKTEHSSLMMHGVDHEAKVSMCAESRILTHRCTRLCVCASATGAGTGGAGVLL
eukprot:scaffold877_cov21-Tisochrysis_lutea.AAC.2